jgi:peptidoglycan-associated lipoprotein
MKRIAWPTLFLVLLLVAGCSKPPVATFEVVQPLPPRIDSITHGAPNGARPGETVSFTLRGDAGLTASASLPGLAETIPLQEDATVDGLYHGILLIPGERAGSYDLTGRLEAAPGRFAVLVGPPLKIIPAWTEGPERELTARDFNARKVLGTIFFEFDRYDLLPDALETLHTNARWLLENKAFRLSIEGHCDERGTNEYNLALGDRRANAARDYLLSAGVSPDRISTISYGEERPAVPGEGEAVWARNRRAEFMLQD